ncbi:hypothetical protein [Sphingosinicella sp. CPCC 101087]|uniref:hypothetical protein n=1 Tax=Sphingosinicella sp. CPCC 101087 TaxID=2497754 RepID=UPI00197F09A0|nr:hypothetical protein [Sphingosinicella sp. CPCC 101087]
MPRRRLLESAFDAAVDACRDPARVIEALPPRPSRRAIILAAGKGAVPMAAPSNRRGWTWKGWS